MAQIFPKWTNKIPIAIWIGFLPCTAVALGLAVYYGSPEFTDVGYRPIQPIPYSHKLHAGELGIDCRYCHAQVEKSAVATIPPTQVCMNCHAVILRDSPKLELLRESMQTGIPIRWTRVHNTPDYAYFDHSVHVGAGVGCVSCHGNIHEMEVVQQAKSLSMGWCLKCHRDPAIPLRPLDEVTNMEWTPPKDYKDYLERTRAEGDIDPPTDCSACHR